MSGSARRKTLLPAILVLLVASASFAQETRRFRGVEFFRDTLWLGNSDGDSAPSPILGVWGAGASFSLGRDFFLLPEMGFYGLDYFYRDGKALPAEIEYADAAGTLVVLVDSLAARSFSITPDTLSVTLGTGPAFSFKIPIVRHGDSPAGEVGSYFIQKMRFLHWEIKAALEWNLTRSLGLSIRLRTLLPVYRIWDPAPFYDGLMAGAGLGLRLRI